MPASGINICIEILFISIIAILQVVIKKSILISFQQRLFLTVKLLFPFIYFSF